MVHKTIRNIKRRVNFILCIVAFVLLNCKGNTTGNNLSDCIPNIQNDTFDPEIESRTYEKRKWNLKCFDTSRTQTDMNICSYEMYKIADSILEEKKITLDSLIDLRISRYSDEIDDSKLFFKSELERYKKMKDLANLIMEQFIAQREAFRIFEQTVNETGTHAPLLINRRMLSLTKNQIIELESIISEL